ncbi:MAG: histidine kinase [Chitinophagaceae bacterium]|nr:histidine kinase [Chitinophagaceae bacterium]
MQVADRNTGKAATIVNTSEPNALKKRIRGIIIAPDNNVYASDDIHFFKYNDTNKTLLNYPLSDQHGRPITGISRNVTDHTGRIFIGSENNGFYVWDYKSGNLLHYNKRDVITSNRSIKDNVLLPNIVDSQNNVWFTSTDGIYEYRQNENKYYHHTIAENTGVPMMTAANYIAEDRLHHFWIATTNNGLYELYFEKGGAAVWKNYTVNSGIGLPSDFCIKVKSSYTDSSLWISNGSGLLRFDPGQKKVMSIITMQNGLTQHGHGYAFNIFPDNILAHLFYGNLNIIDLDAYQQNMFTPAVQFNSVKVLDKEKIYGLDTTKAILYTKYYENFIQFEFASLAYNNGNQGQYAYILEGADKNWIHSGQKNTVSYSGLQPGNYYFRVKAANNDGIWGPESVIKIIIQPPFYTTWWFISMTVLSFISAIYFWNRLRIQQARKEEKLTAAFQQQIAETEMKALRAQMNPHFIFNSLNSIQKYILKNEHFEASQYLTKFSRLIRLILDQSHQNTITLGSELDLLKLYVEMESLRFDNKFEYSFEIDPFISTDTVEIPSMLIQPYVENAIWHGILHKEEKGKLTLRFIKKDENKLLVTIEDNGVGRQKAAELKSKQILKKKSYGMQITENRIAAINRIQNIHAAALVTDLKDETGTATGTRVDLNIPLKTITHK